MPPLPRVIQTPSPNVSARTARIRLIVVHDTEGSYAGAVAWFAQSRSQVSAHLVMREDGAEVTQMVPLSQKAWHACAFNSASIGIEGAGVEAAGFGEAWWRGMAAIVAWLLRRYGLSCRWAEGGSGEGFCSHHDLGPAGGGHNDPCAVGSADWAKFVALVQAAYDEFSKAPLPDWALHGLPAPTSVSLPPPPAATLSHAGAPGAEPGETAASAPWSWPDIQARLRRVGANPTLGLTGHDDEATRLAIATFQRAVGLPASGDLYAGTVAYLDALTS